MRINIKSFKVVEIHRLKEPGFWRNVFGLAKNEYHFDLLIHVTQDDRIKLTGLTPYKDYLELPNKVRILVWFVDIGSGLIRAKTSNWIKDDMVGYRPMEMFLVYSRQHGHMQWN